jgi:hypothetical protein
MRSIYFPVQPLIVFTVADRDFLHVGGGGWGTGATLNGFLQLSHVFIKVG